jgi:hypothetical protein
MNLVEISEYFDQRVTLFSSVSSGQLQDYAFRHAIPTSGSPYVDTVLSLSTLRSHLRWHRIRTWPKIHKMDATVSTILRSQNYRSHFKKKVDVRKIRSGFKRAYLGEDWRKFHKEQRHSFNDYRAASFMRSSYTVLHEQSRKNWLQGPS